MRHGTAVEYCIDTSAWCEYIKLLLYVHSDGYRVEEVAEEEVLCSYELQVLDLGPLCSEPAARNILKHRKIVLCFKLQCYRSCSDATFNICTAVCSRVMEYVYRQSTRAGGRS